MSDTIQRPQRNPKNPALAMMKERFLAADHARVAGAAGAEYDPGSGTIRSTFLGRPCVISCADAQVDCEYFADIFDDSHRVMVLNNLLTATGRMPTGKLIAPREIPGTGAAMIAGLHGVSTAGIEKIVGGEPALLYKILDVMPGERADMGDAAIRIDLLSRVPATFVAWAGEDNIIPPAVTILFDSTVCDYMSNKDAPIILEVAIHQMLRTLQQQI